MDDGNLGDKTVVLGDLDRILRFSQAMGLTINPAKCELIFLCNPSPELQRSVMGQFESRCPEMVTTEIDDMVILGAPMAGWPRCQGRQGGQGHIRAEQ